jgi:hypothetical protein
LLPIIKKGGTPFCYQFEQICGEWDFNVAIIVTIIKKGGAPFVSLRMAKIAPNGTAMWQIRSEWDFLKQKVVIARNNTGKIM